MQLGIAAHSGGYNEHHVKAISVIVDELSKCSPRPILVLGGYWGLMKVVVDEAVKRGLTAVLILPIEQEDVEVPSGVIAIRSGMEYRARSVILVRSSDALIVLGGESGTMIEEIMAYAMGKPVYALVNTGYSTDRLADAYPEYFDSRRIVKVRYFNSPEELVRSLCSDLSKGLVKGKVAEYG